MHCFKVLQCKLEYKKAKLEREISQSSKLSFTADTVQREYLNHQELILDFHT